MQDHDDHPRIREVRALIDNIRHGAAVEASAERLLAMFDDLIEELGRAEHPGSQAAPYQKALG
ncbi:MAG TPA: hypothetical protein VL460_01905 [Caulobacteraceae bacterium]|jgi:hypothetical protein|nr:hypothetical protein [Caulobacteraceae bacterium]